MSNQWTFETPNQTIERFYSYVRIDAETGCHVWNGRNGFGGLYRLFSVRGRLSLVHRFAYELVVGLIPAGLQIDHLCRNTLCVNPAHLEPVTARENMRRGTGPVSRNAAATHCPSGHPYDEENTYKIPSGGRGCKECRREVSRCRDKLHRDLDQSGRAALISGRTDLSTHCRHGHKYSPENIYMSASGTRVCRACRAAHDRKRKSARRAAM